MSYSKNTINSKYLGDSFNRIISSYNANKNTKPKEDKNKKVINSALNNLLYSHETPSELDLLNSRDFDFMSELLFQSNKYRISNNYKCIIDSLKKLLENVNINGIDDSVIVLLEHLGYSFEQLGLLPTALQYYSQLPLNYRNDIVVETISNISVLLNNKEKHIEYLQFLLQLHCADNSSELAIKNYNVAVVAESIADLLAMNDSYKYYAIALANFGEESDKNRIKDKMNNKK